MSQERRPMGRLVRIASLAGVIFVLVSAALVIQAWIPLWPRPLKRSLTEGLLRTVLFTYAGLVLASCALTPILAVLLLKSRRARRPRPLLARAFLIAASCFFSLILLELASAGWDLWMHRLPKLPESFAEQDSSSFRIVVLGGSSALGEPFRPWLSVGQLVAWQLEQADPSRPVECEILAWLGDSLEAQHKKLAAIKHRPEMVIIYSGHNEFAARYEEERDGWLDPDPGGGLAQPLYRASLFSPFCRLAFELISKNRLDVPPPLSGHHQLIDPPQCSPAEAKRIEVDFESRLDAITAYCQRIGALPVLIIPPANEADYEPSRSTLPPAVSQAERDLLVQEFRAARELESRNPALSVAGFQQILDCYPGFAEAHYRLAQLSERAGQLDLAKRHYLAALDNDGLLIRCPAPIRAAISRVAKRHSKCILIDGRRELAEASPRKLLDDHVIEDTHHPTLRGYVVLADAVLRELAGDVLFRDRLAHRQRLDPASCALHFGMDAEKWATVCERTSDHYRRVAGYRYDPAERLEKSRRFAEAAQKLRNGALPDGLGLPGLFLKPSRAGQGAQTGNSDPNLFFRTSRTWR